MSFIYRVEISQNKILYLQSLENIRKSLGVSFLYNLRLVSYYLRFEFHLHDINTYLNSLIIKPNNFHIISC